MAIQKHICGLCHKEFLKEKSYIDHVCKVTGHNPKEVEHFGEGYKMVSNAAIERGQEAEE